MATGAVVDCYAAEGDIEEVEDLWFGASQRELFPKGNNGCLCRRGIRELMGGGSAYD